LRTTGAIASAKIVGNSGRLPVLSSVARVNSRIDYWSFVMLWRLHMPAAYSFRPQNSTKGHQDPAAVLMSL
jgi:hypothetical protein